MYSSFDCCLRCWYAYCKSKEQEVNGTRQRQPFFFLFFLAEACSSTRCRTLTHVYSLCTEQNSLSPALKAASVIPLPKIKDLSDPSNFRLISLRGRAAF